MLRGIVAAVATAVLCGGAVQAQDVASPFRYLRPTVTPEQQAVPQGAPAAEPTESEAPSSDDDAAWPNGDQAGPADGTATLQEPAVPQDPVSPDATGDEPSSPSVDLGATPAPPPDQPGAPANPGGDQPGADSANVAAPPSAPAAIRLGVLAGRDVSATMATLEPVTQALSAALGKPVELAPMGSYGAMVDAQLQHRIDGGFFSAAAFALAEADCRCLEPIAAPAAADGALAYHAVIVARRDSGVRSIADLKGKTVAVGASDSIGARRMQLAGLMAEDIDPSVQFGAMRDAGSAEEAIRLLVSRQVDAAFAWSSLTGSAEQGYSRGTLTEMAARGEINAQDFDVVWRSPAITHSPFAVLKTMADPDKKALAGVLVQLSQSMPDGYDALSPYYSGGYATVDAKAVAGLEILATQKIDEIRFADTEAGKAGAVGTR